MDRKSNLREICRLMQNECDQIISTTEDGAVYDAIDGILYLTFLMLKAADASRHKETKKPLDFDCFSDTIKSMGMNKDGAPYGNQNAAGPHKGDGQKGKKISKKERTEIKKKIVGKKSSKGTVITDISGHAFDQMADRNIPDWMLHKLIASKNTSPDPDYPKRTRYDIPGARLVLGDNGTIISVMHRKKKKRGK